MKRPTIAILDDPVKVRAELGELADLDVVWVGQSVDALMDRLPSLCPQVLVLQLDHLGQAPITRAQLLSTMGQVKQTIVTYSFVRGYVLDALEDELVCTVKEPLTPDRLRKLVAEGLTISAVPGGAEAELASGPETSRSLFGDLLLLDSNSVSKSA